jgi:undecaprenyl-diphosphatase
MSSSSRPPIPSLRLVIALVVLAAIWVEMLTVGTGTADDDILRAVYAGGHPVEVAVARGVTFLGTSWVGIPVAIGGVALLAWMGRRHDAMIAFLVIAVGRLLVEAQKYGIARLRPQDEVHLVQVSTPSFPSGHA